MAKKKEIELIKELSLDDFDKLTELIQEFRHSPEHGVNDESIVIQFMSDGSIRLHGIMECPIDEEIGPLDLI